jgi:hypothetical protein
MRRQFRAERPGIGIAVAVLGKNLDEAGEEARGGFGCRTVPRSPHPRRRLHEAVHRDRPGAIAVRERVRLNERDFAQREQRRAASALVVERALDQLQRDALRRALARMAIRISAAGQSAAAAVMARSKVAATLRG